jgi:hypothetical protein
VAPLPVKAKERLKPLFLCSTLSVLDNRAVEAGFSPIKVFDWAAKMPLPEIGVGHGRATDSSEAF